MADSVLAQVPRSLLEERRRRGLDRWDEVWEGVLHMVPPPHGEHGRLNDRLGLFFQLHWELEGLGRTYPEAGVRRPGAPNAAELGEHVPSDYRTPGRSFLLPGRYDRFQAGWIVGGPDALIEVVPPGDESRAKLPFYAEVGVREVILVDRRTLAVELLRPEGGAFAPAAPGSDGWIESSVLRTRFRRREEPTGPVLELQRADDPQRFLRIVRD